MTPDRFIAAAFKQATSDKSINWKPYTAADFRKYVEELAAELARESVGDGDEFVIVPRIPDMKMANAGVRASHDASILATNNGRALRMVWDAMIAAAPVTAWKTRAAGDKE